MRKSKMIHSRRFPKSKKKVDVLCLHEKFVSSGGEQMRTGLPLVRCSNKSCNKYGVIKNGVPIWD